MLETGECIQQWRCLYAEGHRPTCTLVSHISFLSYPLLWWVNPCGFVQLTFELLCGVSHILSFKRRYLSSSHRPASRLWVVHRRAMTPFNWNTLKIWLWMASSRQAIRQLMFYIGLSVLKLHKGNSLNSFSQTRRRLGELVKAGGWYPPLAVAFLSLQNTSKMLVLLVPQISQWCNGYPSIYLPSYPFGGLTSNMFSIFAWKTPH